MTIRTKLILLISCAVLASLAIGFFGYWGIASNHAVIVGAETEDLPSVAALLRANYQFNRMRRWDMKVSLLRHDEATLGTSQFWDEILQQRQEALSIYQEELQKYARYSQSGEEAQMWRNFQQVSEVWLQDEAQATGLIKRLAAAPASQREPLFNALEQQQLAEQSMTETMPRQLWALVELNEQQMTASLRAASENGERVQWVILLVLAVAGLVLLGIGGAVYRAVLGPIMRTRATIREIAECNDFTLRIEDAGRDEVGDMVEALNGLLARLQETLQAIQGEMRRMQGAVGTLTETSGRVASSSSLQRNSTEAMAAAVEEMTEGVHHIAGYAGSVLALSRKAGDVSEQGSAIIEQMVDGMGQIAASVSAAAGVIERLGQESQQISSVVQVIRDIADQTNLLALNAAIEAARAGEQGRGFAVVANEVRKLAERTANSTGAIGGIVNNIQGAIEGVVAEMQQVVIRVDEGRVLAGEANSQMGHVLANSNELASAVTEISSSLHQQSVASQDIAGHVGSISRMAEDNHAASDRAAASSRELDQLAKEVTRALAVFRV